LGAKYLVVLCAGSTLLLVEDALTSIVNDALAGAVVKLASITFSSLAFSYWTKKPWFLTEGKLATVLIIPSSWGSQLGGHPARINLIFWRCCQGKRRLLQWEFRTHILYFVLVLLLLYFCLHRFYQKHKKFSFLYSCLLCLV
jgi:hypothetical protein